MRKEGRRSHFLDEMVATRNDLRNIGKGITDNGAALSRDLVSCLGVFNTPLSFVA